MTYFQVPKHLAAAVVVAGASALAAAYISQYGFGLKPCILCLYQRVPYFVNVALGLLAFLVTFRSPRLAVLLLWAAALSFFADAAIAGFHVGVEQGWWKGLPSCGGEIVPEHVSLEELRQSLTHQDIVRCDKPAWVMFGISMAGYNFALTLALGLALSCLLWRGKR
ncbi:MAG: disulfide bond formation protein B [Proteobacteria bacterium]|nr:disulfide bond formation protein B [Pseudomonadota bacterium]